MAKTISGGYHPQSSSNLEQKGYKPLTEGYKPQGNGQMPTSVPPLPSGVVPASASPSTPSQAGKAEK